MDYVYGKIYKNGRFQTGYLGFENGTIKITGGRPSDKIRNNALAKGLIIPTFRNAHTHLADSFLYGQFAGSSIEQLVDPRSGLKMRKLKTARESTIVNASKEVLREMLHTGTSSFIDFREMGMKGILQSQKSIEDLPIEAHVMGRPFDTADYKKDIDDILTHADGIGLSALNDWPIETVTAIAKRTKRRKKKFALHVSEGVREDIDKVIDLRPDFIIHMIESTRSDLEAVSENDIPVVVCPRANMFFGKYPDITAMSEAGIRLMLGTDNAMISRPDMFREVQFAYRCAKLTGGISPGEIMRIVFDNPDTVFSDRGSRTSSPLSRNRPARFAVVDVPHLNGLAHPENLLCLGLSSRQLDLICLDNYIWRRLK